MNLASRIVPADGRKSSALPSAINYFRDLAYPLVCPVCEMREATPDAPVCEACAEQLPPIPEPSCPVCGGPLDTAVDACHECLTQDRSWRHGYTGWTFDGLARELVHRYKYRGDLALLPVFRAVLLTRLAAPGPPSYDVVIPVPLHWWRQFRRGYNQAELLARELATGLGCDLQTALCRCKWTTSQTRLSLSQRQRNLRQAFAARRDLHVADARVLVVDDVLTTGSTLSACSAIIREAGAAAVDVITIARG